MNGLSYIHRNFQSNRYTCIIIVHIAQSPIVRRTLTRRKYKYLTNLRLFEFRSVDLSCTQKAFLNFNRENSSLSLSLISIGRISPSRQIPYILFSAH